MYYVYILFSERINEYYCGQCNEILNRIKRHNSGETKSIKHGIPWKLVGYVLTDSRPEAMQLERRIKKRGIGRWLQDNPTILIQPR